MFAHVHASLTLHFPGCSVLLRDPHHQKMDGDRGGGSKENKDTTSPATKIGFWGGFLKCSVQTLIWMDSLGPAPS